MKKKFTEEQIAFALKQAEHGTPVVEVIRKMGITEQTYYRWKKKYGGLGMNELRRLKQLEEENRKLKSDGGGSEPGQIYASGCALKKVIKPAARRHLVIYLTDSFQVSERQACEVLCIGRSTYRYRSIADCQEALKMRIRELAAIRVRYGYKRIHILL